MLASHDMLTLTLDVRQDATPNATVRAGSRALVPLVKIGNTDDEEGP